MARTRAGGEPHEPAAGKGGEPAWGLSVELTPDPTPFGAYVKSVQTGNPLYLRGVLPTAASDNRPRTKNKAG